MELDCPNARQMLGSMIAQGQTEGWLDATVEDSFSHASSESSMHCGLQQIPAFKSKVESLIREYFDTLDGKEVKISLDELQEPGLMHIFVKKVCRGIEGFSAVCFWNEGSDFCAGCYYGPRPCAQGPGGCV